MQITKTCSLKAHFSVPHSKNAQKRRGVPSAALHEPQGSLANVTWHPAMGWSFLDHSWSSQPPTPPIFCLFASLWARPMTVFTCEGAPSTQQKAANTSGTHHVFITFQNVHHTRTPSFSRLPPRPRLALPSAPARPLVDPSICPCTGSSLTHECREGRAC